MHNLIKEPGKKGQSTYKYNNKYIYSSYDPVNEAKKYLDSLPEIKKYAITCCGADYINSALLEKKIETIISFEPIDFDNKIVSDKIVRTNSIDDIENKLLEKNIHAKDITLIIWQPLIEALPEIYLESLKKIKNILYKSSISANTQNALGFKESFNFLLNILTADNFSYLKKNNNKVKNPAMIISSGASLKDNIEFIKDTGDRAYIFSLPSALPFLQHNNIHPDFVIAVDPGYGTYYHLVKYKKNINLLAPLTVTPTILRLNNITPIIFNYYTYLENMLFSIKDIVTTPAEGTVFINLLRILPQMGFSDAILIGQDFGYKDNRSHINEGSFELEFLQNANYYSTLEYSLKNIEASQDLENIEISDKKIKTNFAFKLYYEHFIKKEFDLNIFLPYNCFNPLSDKYKKINMDFLINNYNKKVKITEVIKTENYKDLYQRKNDFVKLLNELNDDSANKEIKDKLSINKKNINHLNKIKKVLS